LLPLGASRSRPNSPRQPPDPAAIIEGTYQWLLYAHVGSVLLFLLAHGASAAMALRLKGEPSADGIKALVVLSMLSSQATYPLAYPAVLTGIWLAAAGGWFGRAWIWTAIVVLVLTVGLMNALGRQHHPLRVAAGRCAAATADANRGRPQPRMRSAG
jgi:hypothetical protein